MKEPSHKTITLCDPIFENHITFIIDFLDLDKSNLELRPVGNVFIGEDRMLDCITAFSTVSFLLILAPFNFTSCRFKSLVRRRLLSNSQKLKLLF